MSSKARFRRGPLVAVALCLLIAAGALCFGPARAMFTTMPDTVRIGTASRGGAYAKLGFAFESHLEAALGTTVHAKVTSGSEQNVDRLATGDLELAIIQSDAHHSDRVEAVAALFAEYLHIVVRKDSIPNAKSIQDLNGKRLAIGPKGSGTRKLVQRVLTFFEIAYTAVDFTSVAEEGEALRQGLVDAYCRVAGRPDAIVAGVLEDKQCRLIPLVSADGRGVGSPLLGFDVNFRGYAARALEARTYAGQHQAIPTLVVTALLVARRDLDAAVVERVARTLEDKRVEMRRNAAIAPYLRDRLDVRTADTTFRVHRGARDYLDGPGARSWIPWAVAALALLVGLVIGLRELRRIAARRKQGTHTPRHFATDPSDVFISYSTQAPIAPSVVKTICEHLESHGLRCWYAPRDIPGGDSWPGHISAAIDQCRRAMVVIYSKEVQTSEHILREMTLAGARKLTILPFRIEPVTPQGAAKYFLSNVQWIDALPSVTRDHLEELRAAVERVQVQEPPSQGDALATSEATSEATEDSSADTPEPRDARRKVTRRLVGATAAIAVVAALALWQPWRPPHPQPSVTLQDGPILVSPADGSFRLGGLTYKWRFEGHGPRVHYEVERRIGDDVMLAREVRDQAFREEDSAGTIAVRVRAHVPSPGGDLVYTAWSATHVVERFADTLDRIVANRRIVVAVSDEVYSYGKEDPELFVLRHALQRHLKSLGQDPELAVDTVSRPWGEMKTLLKSGSTYDVMAARISNSAKREGAEGWGVVFTEPVFRYPQVLVHLPRTELHVANGATGRCRIAVRPGTTNHEAADRLAQQSEATVHPSPEKTFVYAAMYERLLDRTVDVLLMDLPFGEQIQREAKTRTPVKLTILDTSILDPMPWENIAIATRPRDDRLRTLLNETLTAERARIDQMQKDLRPERPYLREK